MYGFPYSDLVDIVLVARTLMMMMAMAVCWVPAKLGGGASLVSAPQACRMIDEETGPRHGEGSRRTISERNCQRSVVPTLDL
jgi:hypothetical protein